MTWSDDGTPDIEDALLYVDGVLEAISATNPNVVHSGGGAPIDVNLGDSVIHRSWDGWLDDMRVYDEALDADAILAIATETAIPEPCTLLLAALGLLGLLCGRRRRGR